MGAMMIKSNDDVATAGLPTNVPATRRAKTATTRMSATQQKTRKMTPQIVKNKLFEARTVTHEMHLMTESGSTYWNLVSQIKQTLDPGGIISPGRYCPIPTPTRKKESI